MALLCRSPDLSGMFAAWRISSRWRYWRPAVLCCAVIAWGLLLFILRLMHLMVWSASPCLTMPHPAVQTGCRADTRSEG